MPLSAMRASPAGQRGATSRSWRVRQLHGSWTALECHLCPQPTDRGRFERCRSPICAGKPVHPSGRLRAYVAPVGPRSLRLSQLLCSASRVRARATDDEHGRHQRQIKACVSKMVHQGAVIVPAKPMVWPSNPTRTGRPNSVRMLISRQKSSIVLVMVSLRRRCLPGTAISTS